MRRSELPHEQKKTNLAEPLASKSWPRCTGKNFSDFVKNGVFQQYRLCTAVRRALHERLVWDELTYAAGFCINLRQHLCRKCRKCRSLKRLHAELLQTRKMSLKSGQP